MLTGEERRRLAARLGWNAHDTPLGEYEAEMARLFGYEQPVTGGAAGGAAYPRRGRTRTLWELARQMLGEERAAAVFHNEAERVGGWNYGDPGAALDALAVAVGLTLTKPPENAALTSTDGHGDGASAHRPLPHG